MIEVIVVIAILGLLAAILLPALQRARALPKAVVCASNLRQIGQAVAMYRNEYGFAPFLGEIPHKDPKLIRPTPEEMLGEYLQNEFGVFQCPTDVDEPVRRDWYVWRTDSGTKRPWADVPDRVSYMWSEQLLRGFYPRYPFGTVIDGRCAPPWKAIPWSWVKEPYRWGILSEGAYIFNAWKWRTLDPGYSDRRLDQQHYDMDKTPRVNMLFATGNVVLIPCDEESLRSVRSDPYGLDPW